MPRTNFTSVDEYIASQPEAVRSILSTVRVAILHAIPDATEVISYQIPCYKLPQGPVIYFAGWKQHYSLYPATEQLVRRFEKELSRYEISKGTIRFPLSEPVPGKLVERIAKVRAEETVQRAKAKAAYSKRSSKG